MTKHEADFIRYDKEYLDAHQASGLAYALRDTIAVAFCAFDNDCIDVELGNRGISSTLERAEKMARELIDRCEMLERDQARAQQ